MIELQIEPLEYELLQIGAAEPGRVADRLAERNGIRLPREPNTSTHFETGHWACWFGPRQWLVGRAVGSYPPLIELIGAQRGIPGCLIVDVSASYLIWQLSGADLWDWLSCGCPLDPAELAAGGCAHTLYEAHPVFLHRRTGESLDLYLPRSYAEDFRTNYLPAGT